VALLVTGADPAVLCVSLYVQSNGTLDSRPVYRSPAGWGTVHVRGIEINPSTTYVVQAECDTGPAIRLSTPATDTTWMWADTDNSGGLVDILDIVWIVDAFRSVFQMSTLYATDIWGDAPESCMPQLVIDILDMIMGVDAFKQIPYHCDDPCP
jgi:hypothetical protein